jgi:hypothetical protein
MVQFFVYAMRASASTLHSVIDEVESISGEAVLLKHCSVFACKELREQRENVCQSNLCRPRFDLGPEHYRLQV